MLAAELGRFLDGFLGLFLGADEQNLAALADSVGKKIARCLKLFDRLAEVDDVNAVARVENERLHFGVPAFGLVSEMNAGVQQFL